MRMCKSALILAAGLLAVPLQASSRGVEASPIMPAVSITFAAKEKSKKPPTPAQLAARERQKKCGAEWKAAKAAGSIEKGMKWPQYWSACNKRLMSGG